MRLTAKELNRLTVFTAAELARRRLHRGRKLNVPEAIAVICDEVFELAWDGLSLPEVIARASRILSRNEVMEGVPEIVEQIEVDALFPSGTTLVVVKEPFGPPGDRPAPGEIIPGEKPVEINTGRESVRVTVTNTSAVPVEVSSHFHFFEANRQLLFDRRRAFGMRLDIPAGTSTSWSPGESKTIGLIPFAGARQVWGFGGLVDGPVESSDPEAALLEAVQAGYLHEEAGDGE